MRNNNNKKYIKEKEVIEERYTNIVFIQTATNTDAEKNEEEKYFLFKEFRASKNERKMNEKNNNNKGCAWRNINTKQELDVSMERNALTS